MKYDVIIHTPVLSFSQEKSFEALLVDGFKKAFLFYKIKKDKALSLKLRKMIKDKEFDIERLSWEIEKEIAFPFQIKCCEGELEERRIYVEPFVVEPEILDDEGFYAHAFWGKCRVDIEGEQNLKPCCLAYTEAILKRELRVFSAHSEVIRNILERLINEIKNKWEIPLRVGLFNRYKFYEKFLFLYRDKELKKILRRKFNYRVDPIEVLFLPAENTVPGLIELKQVV